MMPFPGDVLACVRVGADNYPTVYINDSLSLDAKRRALRHELQHFRNGDFHNHLSVWDAEAQAIRAETHDVMPRQGSELSNIYMIVGFHEMKKAGKLPGLEVTA